MNDDNVAKAPEAGAIPSDRQWKDQKSLQDKLQLHVDETTQSSTLPLLDA